MAYDEELADRIRLLLRAELKPAERKMFGGLAFLIGGNMAVAASRGGGLLVRIDPAENAELLTRASVEQMVMAGQERIGWVRVAPDAVDDDAVLREWVDRGVNYARTLPPKTQ